MDELLEQFRTKLESRNATDFLESLVVNFNGHLGAFLLQQQAIQDNSCQCTECTNDFPDNIE